MVRAGKCLYCGKVLDPNAGTGEPRLSPEVLIALETGSRKVPRGRRWMIRMTAVALAGVLLWVFAGPCMRM